MRAPALRAVLRLALGGVATGCVIVQMAWAQTSEDAPAAVTPRAAAAFAMFSPLVVSPTPRDALVRAGRPVDMTFGVAAEVVDLAEDGTAAEIRLANGERGWVNTADVLLGDASSLVTTGPEFRVTSRPGMRVYFDHYGLTHFLSRGAASSRPADLTELHDRPTRFDLALPVLTSGRAHVLGDRTAGIVQVLLPISSDLVRARQDLQGITGPGFDIRILVDGSEDAREFASSLLLSLARPLEALIDGETAEHTVFLSRYSEVAPFGTYGEVTMAELRRPMQPDVANRVLTGREPTIGAISREISQVRAEAAGTVLIVMNGGDIGDLSAAGAPFMEQVERLSGVIVVETTPEVSPDLGTLSERIGSIVPTEFVEFGPTQTRDIMRTVSEFIRADGPSALSTQDARALCDVAQATLMPCLLPSTDDLGGSFPEPSGGAVDPDWFSVVGWIVLDGAIFRLDDAATRP